VYKYKKANNTLARVCYLLLLSGVAAQTAPIVFSASGANPAIIQTSVDAFRSALGPLNPPNTPGSVGSGRREVNWDGVPDMFASPNNFPGNFFSARGVEFVTPGFALQVSANAAAGMVEFDNINPTYSGIFQTFSPQRLFASLGSNLSEVNFFVPGSTTPSFSTGFGAVFTDVDLADTTTLHFFGVGNSNLGTFSVPTANNGVSFLGVSFNAGEQISRVLITSGNSSLGITDGVGGADVVAMDDFIFAEPVNIPEPSTWVLFWSGTAAFLLASRPLFNRR